MTADDRVATGLRETLNTLEGAETLLRALIELRRLERPPPPPNPSGLPWASGFANCADEVLVLAAWRNRPCAHFSAWTNYVLFARSFDGLRGGPANQLDVLGPMFTQQGAYNLVKALRILPAETPLTWVYPMLPVDLGNTRPAGGSWTRPGIWAELAGPSRGMWSGVWFEVGFRTAALLAKAGKRYDLFTHNIGWEGPGGTWYPWSVGPDVKGWKDAWRVLRDSHRQGALAFDPKAEALRVELRIAGEQKHEAWTLAELWPGRDYLDVLGRSCHEGFNQPWAKDAWWTAETRQTSGFGLEDALALAERHGVPLAIDEWSVQLKQDGQRPPSADPAGAVARMWGFLQQHHRLIQCECYLHNSGTRLLGNEAVWPAAQAYLDLWGG
jgi:hypothetical protein